jgi:hypothetical protein
MPVLSIVPVCAHFVLALALALAEYLFLAQFAVGGRVAGWTVDKFKNGALSCVDGSLFASPFL